MVLQEPSAAGKVSKYGVISGLYFSVFSPNTGKYGPEITPYLNTSRSVGCCFAKIEINPLNASVAPI